jgi:hypothetical protein
MGSGDAQEFLQIRAAAGGTLRLVISADQKLKFLVAFAAGVFVERHK